MQGKIHVYTGNGKGKTTASIGLAVRAACAGMRVYVGQFLKVGRSSESCLTEVFPGRVVMEQYGAGGLLTRGRKATEEDRRKAAEGLARLAEVLGSGDFDLVVADELCVGMSMGLLAVDEVMEALQGRSEGVEVVVTGRNAPAALLDKADLVTEMRELRHYFTEEGLQARKGIEF